MTIRISPNDKGSPAGKLADAEIHFQDGPLAGLKLLGFAIWERRNGSGRNVTFPARQYSVSGERRSFALLRPATETKAQDHIRDLILSAYAAYEADAEAGTTEQTATGAYQYTPQAGALNTREQAQTPASTPAPSFTPAAVPTARTPIPVIPDPFF